jgi:hypothetical protein
MLGGILAPITIAMFENLTFAGALSLLSGLVYKPFVVPEP